jgi:hypothetical protein
MENVHGKNPSNVFVGFHEIPWKLPCNSVEFHGIQWNSMEFHETEVDGIPWNSMDGIYVHK